MADSGHPAHPGGGDQTASGHRIWVQVDSVVISVQADLTGGVFLAGVKKLAKEQVACLEDDGPCDAVAVPDSLFEED